MQNDGTLIILANGHLPPQLQRSTMSHIEKVRPLFAVTRNRGIILIFLAVVWPLVLLLLFVSEFPRNYVPFFQVVRHNVLFFLLLGGLGSIFASTYSSLAHILFRPFSTFTITLVCSSVLAALIFTLIFSTIIILNEWYPILGSACVVIGYVAVLLNIYVTSTELWKLYVVKGCRPDRNDTQHAWAAFLFSVDLVLITAYFTGLIYVLLKM